MYGVPLNLDLSNLVGNGLNLLGLGKYDVQFNFDGSGIKICVQGDISLLEKGELIATWNGEDNWSSLNFQKIINATVESFSVRNSKLIEIKFEQDIVLQLHDSSDQYETIIIHFGGDSGVTEII